LLAAAAIVTATVTAAIVTATVVAAAEEYDNKKNDYPAAVT